MSVVEPALLEKAGRVQALARSLEELHERVPSGRPHWAMSARGSLGLTSPS